MNLITFPSLNVEVATFNLNSSSKASTIFADKRVRQALWWGLDRPAIIKAAFFGAGGLFTNSPEPPGTWAHLKTTNPNYSFNPTKANQILDAAGWTKDSSGMRSKNGQSSWRSRSGPLSSYITADRGDGRAVEGGSAPTCRPSRRRSA